MVRNKDTDLIGFLILAISAADFSKYNLEMQFDNMLNSGTSYFFFSLLHYSCTGRFLHLVILRNGKRTRHIQQSYYYAVNLHVFVFLASVPFHEIVNFHNILKELKRIQVIKTRGYS